MKPCIVSFFMPNIHPATVEKQKAVVKKMNPSDIEHVLVKCPMPTVDNNGDAVNSFMTMNSKREDMNFDIIVILDIDCIPLNPKALDHLVEQAAAGSYIGNAQRSNHIQNDQHVFVAPSLQAFSLATYDKMGRPTFRETKRGDMSEELTYAAEEKGIPIKMYMPLRYERPSPEAPAGWPLADGMPRYGLGTTYGDEEFGDMTYHHFQIRHPGNQKRFVEKCEEVLDS